MRFLRCKEDKKEKRAGLDLIMEKADLGKGYAEHKLNYDAGKLPKRSALYSCRGK